MTSSVNQVAEPHAPRGLKVLQGQTAHHCLHAWRHGVQSFDQWCVCVRVRASEPELTPPPLKHLCMPAFPICSPLLSLSDFSVESVSRSYSRYLLSEAGSQQAEVATGQLCGGS
jgi:hypothetical protein